MLFWYHVSISGILCYTTAFGYIPLKGGILCVASVVFLAVYLVVVIAVAATLVAAGVAAADVDNM